VSILAVGSLLLACSDDGGSDGPAPGEGINFDGGDGQVPSETIVGLEVGPDAPPAAECDPAFLGKYCSSKPCTGDTDCTGIGTGKCGTGGFCENPTQCGDKNLCLSLGTEDDGTRWGICTCNCVADDPATPLVVEDNCPDLTKNQCSSELEVSINANCTSDADCVSAVGQGWTCEVATGRCLGIEAFCLKFCDPQLGTNTCDGKLACDPGAGATWGVFDKTVCSRKGCTKDEECLVDIGTTCNPKTDNCQTGEKCLVLDIRGDTDGCTQDSECETDYVCADLEGHKYCTYKEGRCSKPGKCDTASGLCDVHPAGTFKVGAKVGDTCNSDLDCEKNQTCLFELDWSKMMKKMGTACKDDGECCSNTCTGGTCAGGGYCTTQYRNGYCTTRGCAFATTLAIRACDATSDCNRIYSGGLCQKKCTLADAPSCRGNASDYLGDYECRNWSGISAGGPSMTKGPVCDFGTVFSCDVFTQLGCESWGETGNPTNMKCRTLAGIATANVKDPLGFCLDDTASGTTVRSPLPTP